MKTLLLLRHAKSSWDDSGVADHDRPLNARGKQDAPRVGRLLREADLKPDAVLSSTARRARKTAQKALEASGYEVEIQLVPALYQADVGTWFRVLHELPDACECVLAVGHNPGIGDLLHMLSGGRESMTTAAFAHLELPIDSWHQLTLGMRAVLRNFWVPKEID